LREMASTSTLTLVFVAATNQVPVVVTLVTSPADTDWKEARTDPFTKGTQSFTNSVTHDQE
jgi:hypothetical protein